MRIVLLRKVVEDRWVSKPAAEPPSESSDGCGKGNSIAPICADKTIFCAVRRRSTTCRSFSALRIRPCATRGRRPGVQGREALFSNQYLAIVENMTSDSTIKYSILESMTDSKKLVLNSTTIMLTK